MTRESKTRDATYKFLLVRESWAHLPQNRQDWRWSTTLFFQIIINRFFLSSFFRPKRATSSCFPRHVLWLLQPWHGTGPRIPACLQIWWHHGERPQVPNFVPHTLGLRLVELKYTCQWQSTIQQHFKKETPPQPDEIHRLSSLTRSNCRQWTNHLPRSLLLSFSNRQALHS